MQINKIPTGFLFVDDYENGQLETLSIGDYGKSKNVKADFLGFSKPINGVPNGPCMPLSEKWVITLSTQYGCPMECTFCDVPNIPFKGNVSLNDFKKQFYSAIDMFPDVLYTDRLNIHFARMGEPFFNYERIFEFWLWLYFNKYTIQRTKGLRIEVIHPVFTTCMPKINRFKVDDCLCKINELKNQYNGQAGLQLSINSTNETQRNKMFGNMVFSLKEISKFCDMFLKEPIGRKYCLNFAYASDFIVDANVLRSLFDPEKFMVKITPIHNNNACRRNSIETLDGYKLFAPYQKIEEELKNAGFDVLVFIPSFDEENSLVTCGNAILGGGKICEREGIK